MQILRHFFVNPADLLHKPFKCGLVDVPRQVGNLPVQDIESGIGRIGANDIATISKRFFISLANFPSIYSDSYNRPWVCPAARIFPMTCPGLPNTVLA